MKTYVLVVPAGLSICSEDMASLIGKRYRTISAMGEAVGQILGTADDWRLYSAEDFCEKWNNIPFGYGIPSPDNSYIAIVEVEHDE
jgi:hypothetical protein